MPVDQKTYRGWEGKARASRAVSLAIAATMIRRLFRLRLVRYTVIVFPLGASIIASFVFGLVHQGEGRFPLAVMMRRGGFASEHVLPLVNRWALGHIGFFGVLLAALVGAPLIAEDRRAHALPLYFSRPITHFDYVLGKLLTLWFYLGLLFLVPPLCMYLLDVGFSDAEGVARERLPVFLRSLVPGAVQMVALSAVALGVSAMARRTSYAALFFFALMMIALVMSQLLSREVFEDPDWQALSPWLCARRIAIDLLPLPPQLNREDTFLASMGLGAAWTSLSLWTAAGLAALVARIRRVEVVA